jgi:nicotinamidase-related amidase
MMKTTELLDRKDTALVVVDVQQLLIPTIFDSDKMVHEIKRLLSFADVIGMDAVHAEQIKLGTTVEPLAELMGDRQPYLKSSFGCFGNEEFAARVESFGVKNLILTGMETHVCVMQTAMQALARGYRVQVALDAVSSSTPLKKEVGLKRMSDAGVEITCAESLIFELLGRAGTDEFRACLPIIK